MGFSECVDTILILDRPELLIWRNIVDGLCHFALLLTGSHSIHKAYGFLNNQLHHPNTYEMSSNEQPELCCTDESVTLDYSINMI